MTVIPMLTLPRERLEEAADWWARIQDTEAPPEDLAQWLEWLDADPVNREAFERIKELSLRLRATGFPRAPAVRATHARRYLWPPGLAATIILLAGGILFVRGNPFRPVLVFTTPVAVLEQAALPDGSSVSLGGATSIEAHYSRFARDIRLTEGEVYFEVRHEPGLRPFIVNAGKVSIRAVGTAFNVRKTHDRVTITVTQGRVQATRVARSASGNTGAPVLVGAGEQAVYDPSLGTLQLSAVDTHPALGWRERRLEFVDEPLDSVIDNINRYIPHPIEARDSDLHLLTYTGTVRPETLDDWLTAIGRAFPIVVERDGAETVIYHRR